MTPREFDVRFREAAQKDALILFAAMGCLCLIFSVGIILVGEPIPAFACLLVCVVIGAVCWRINRTLFNLRIKVSDDILEYTDPNGHTSIFPLSELLEVRCRGSLRLEFQSGGFCIDSPYLHTRYTNRPNPTFRPEVQELIDYCQTFTQKPDPPTPPPRQPTPYDFDSITKPF